MRRRTRREPLAARNVEGHTAGTKEGSYYNRRRESGEEGQAARDQVTVRAEKKARATMPMDLPWLLVATLK